VLPCSEEEMPELVPVALVVIVAVHGLSPSEWIFKRLSPKSLNSNLKAQILYYFYPKYSIKSTFSVSAAFSRIIRNMEKELTIPQKTKRLCP